MTNGPTAASSSCQGTGASSFCTFATAGNGASVANPIAMGFDFESTVLDQPGPHVQVSLDVRGHHFSQTVPVPEPQTYALMLAGLGAVALMARRRKGCAVPCACPHRGRAIAFIGPQPRTGSARDGRTLA